MTKHIILALLVLQGVVFAVAAFLLHRRKSAWLQNADETNGEVLELRATEDGLFRPVVQYRVDEGDEVTVESRQGRTRWPFDIGDRVTVLVSRFDATDAQIKSFMGQWFPTVACVIISLVSLLLAVLFQFVLPADIALH